MKILFTILFTMLATHFTFAETGERFNLLWELGERIKHEERKSNPDSAKLNTLRSIKTELLNGIEAVYDSMGRKGDPWIQDAFTKQNADALRSFLPQDDFFNATATIGAESINSESGFIKNNTLWIGLMGILFTILGWFGVKKFMRK